MGNKSLEQQTNGPEAFKIITYPGPDLPDHLKPIVFSKTLRTLRNGNKYFKAIDQEIYYDVYHRYIQSILNRRHTLVHCAILESDPDIVLAFSINENKTLHYIYTAFEVRLQGIAKELMNHQPFDTITHLTNSFEKILAKRKDLKFNPFI